MRLLIVNSYYNEPRSGGAEMVLSILARGMVQRGHEVCVVATTDQAAGSSQSIDGVQITKTKIRNLYWPLDSESRPTWQRVLWHAIDRRNPWAGRDVARVAQTFRPDVVSLHNLAGLSSAVWPALKALGHPMAQMLHDYQLICPNVAMFKDGKVCQTQCRSCATFRGPHRQLSGDVDAVIAPSQSVLDTYRREGYFLGVSRQVIIRNARRLSPSLASDASTQVPPRDDAVVTFGFIGALAVIKGIEPLLETFSRAADSFQHPVRLLVAGDGKDDYVEHLKQRYASARVQFLGRVDPVRFYSAVDVAVVPSLCHDTFPSVVFEALSFGVPVIGAKRGGIPEVIQDGSTGLIYDPEQTDGLLGAMRALADSPALRSQMSSRAPASVAHLMDEDRFVREHEALYQTLIDTRRTTGRGALEERGLQGAPS